MATLEDIGKRIAAALAEAKSQNISFYDVLPKEVLGCFIKSKELKDANDHMEAITEREKRLLEHNEVLKRRLKEVEQALQDIPVNHSQVLVDLGQAQGRVIFYRGLAKAAEDRASKFEKKWQEAMVKQSILERNEAKVQRLEAEVRDGQLRETKIKEESHRLKEMFDDVHAKTLEALEDKEETIKRMKIWIDKTDEMYDKVLDDSEDFDQAYHRLVMKIDEENADCIEKLNQAMRFAETNNQLRSAIFSEIVPLRKFYGHSSKILKVYQHILGQLLSIDGEFIRDLPYTFCDDLEAATNEMYAFNIICHTMDTEGFLDDEVRKEIWFLGQSATVMLQYLSAIAKDLSNYFSVIEKKPDMRRLMGMKMRIPRW